MRKKNNSCFFAAWKFTAWYEEEEDLRWSHCGEICIITAAQNIQRKSFGNYFKGVSSRRLALISRGFLFIYLLKTGLLFALLICSWCVRTVRVRMFQSCVITQGVHSVQRCLLSLLHRDVIQPYGWEGEAAGAGGGAGQAASSQGNCFSFSQVTSASSGQSKWRRCGKTSAGVLLNPPPPRLLLRRRSGPSHPLNMCESGGVQQCRGSIASRQDLCVFKEKTEQNSSVHPNCVLISLCV